MGIRTINHFRNLSRGLSCPCPTPKFHIIRIQSTHCEQKHWDRILHDVGAELLFTIASGQVAIVHDMSEHPHESRACWQGLSWIRYACFRTWNGNLNMPQVEKSRGGFVLNPYWEEQWLKLPRSTVSWVDYFRKYYTLGGYIFLRSCWNRGGGRRVLSPAQEVAQLYNDRVLGGVAGGV